MILSKISAVSMNSATNFTCMYSTCTNVCINNIAPTGLSAPVVNAYNDTSMVVSWKPPAQPNGPAPIYTVRRATGAFNHPPLEVSPGTRFNGKGYYKFSPDTIPQGVSFTGNLRLVCLLLRVFICQFFRTYESLPRLICFYCCRFAMSLNNCHPG